MKGKSPLSKSTGAPYTVLRICRGISKTIHRGMIIPKGWNDYRINVLNIRHNPEGGGIFFWRLNDELIYCHYAGNKHSSIKWGHQSGALLCASVYHVVHPGLFMWHPSGVSFSLHGSAQSWYKRFKYLFHPIFRIFILIRRGNILNQN